MLQIGIPIGALDQPYVQVSYWFFLPKQMFFHVPIQVFHGLEFFSFVQVLGFFLIVQFLPCILYILALLFNRQIIFSEYSLLILQLSQNGPTDCHWFYAHCTKKMIFLFITCQRSSLNLEFRIYQFCFTKISMLLFVSGFKVSFFVKFSSIGIFCLFWLFRKKMHRKNQ